MLPLVEDLVVQGSLAISVVLEELVGLGVVQLDHSPLRNQNRLPFGEVWFLWECLLPSLGCLSSSDFLPPRGLLVSKQSQQSLVFALI